MMHEVIGPDVIAMLRPKPYTRSVIQPEPPFLWLFHWHFKPFTTPQAFHAFVVHLPPCVPQEGRNPAIAISAVLACQLDHVRNQTLLVSPPLWQPTLCGPVLTQNTANSSLRYLEPDTHMINASPPTRRAQKFPDAASFRINLSSVRSETARRGRSFSF